MKIEVDVIGLAEAERLIRGLPITAKAAVKDVVNVHAFKIANEAKKNLKALKAWDTGILARSIRPTFSDGGLAAVVGSDAAHAPFIEYGTGPAAGHARYFPPKGALLGWIKRRVKLDEGETPESVEYVIRRKLFLEGTKPRPYLIPAWEKVKPEYKRALQEAFDNFGGS